eukprot:TRINITY_DN7305_c0_g1_i1.p1 TRINITY_DN7305_c0_g1~~TRINITY_DN7305_c0_g1_i1.p1  ORF type:complete len:807 (-),score=160.58 TRINITY_DN7305_c0_g1_i1:133-2553(-)
MACCGPPEGTSAPYGDAKDKADKVQFPPFPREMKEEKNKARGRPDLDCFCCLSFGVLICIGLLVAAFFHGKWQRINHGYDYAGNLCGIDAGFENASYVFYCGSKQTVAPDHVYPEHLYFRATTCVTSCPTSNLTAVPCLRPEQFRFSEKGAYTDATTGVIYDRRYEVDIKQRVEEGKTYPTTPVGWHCMPKDEGLKLSLTNGPIASQYRWAKLAQAVIAAWPVVLGSAILAAALGYTYLHFLTTYAGMMLFGCLVGATIVISAFGVFFSIAILFNPEDYDNPYCRANPVVHTYQSTGGKFLSFWIGILLMFFGVFLGFSTLTSMQEIDKSIGVVNASIKCVFSTYEMTFGAFFKAFGICLQLLLCMSGLAFLSTVGYMDSDAVRVNGNVVDGIEATFKWYRFWDIGMGFYAFMTWWLFEIAIAVYQFSMVYGVAQWYFVMPPEREKAEGEAAVKMGSKKTVTSVGLTGVDKGGARNGIQVKTSTGNTVVVLPVGKKIPGGQVLAETPTAVTYTYLKPQEKKMPSMAVAAGTGIALTHHLGSLAKAAFFYVPIARIFRLAGLAMRALVGREKDGGEEESLTGAMTKLGIVISAWIENQLCGYSRNAYCDMVLSGNGFHGAVKEATFMIGEAGGGLHYMHGCCAVFECVGTIMIIAICAFSADMTLKNLPCFTDETRPDTWYCGYVEDSYDLTVLICAMTGVIGFAFMSLTNIAMDTMLYTLAWARRVGFDATVHKKILPQHMVMFEKDIDSDPGPRVIAASPFGQAHVKGAVKRLGATAMATAKDSAAPLLSTLASVTGRGGGDNSP